jgi:hypothetical protein
MAQNVIVPIIDLTSAAEGTTVGVNLQTALAFGSQTAFDIGNTTTVIANTAGFWRIFGVSQLWTDSVTVSNTSFTMSDGLSVKKIWQQNTIDNSTYSQAQGFLQYDFTVFLASGESISGSASTSGNLVGSARQIADVNGTLINPSGFTPQ